MKIIEIITACSNRIGLSDAYRMSHALWGRSLTCRLTESLTPWIGSEEMRIRGVGDPSNRQVRDLPHNSASSLRYNSKKQ